MPAYYNEIDPFAAQWLRNLIAAGHIAPGEVDERSIVEVDHRDLRGFDQCHFFAGIGVWSHALRLAGWSDARPVWTASCPCQPFSAAGAGKEFADERHLWPALFELVRVERPLVVFGEQVASRDALAWLDHVCADMEGEGYAVGAVDTCAAGYGAPHIRQRLYWVADSEGERRGRRQDDVDGGRRERALADSGEAGGLADADGATGSGEQRLFAQRGNGDGPARNGERSPSGMADTASPRADGGQREQDGARDARGAEPAGSGGAGIMADSTQRGLGIERDASLARDGGHADSGQQLDATNGFWRDADWLPCRDAKARPTEPGTFPLVAGTPSRVGRLRAYGNSIVAPQAAEFVQAYMIEQT